MTVADFAIRNARILDGSGSAAVEGDVAVAAGRIVSVGTAGQAKHDIDANGQVLAPGFIDTHSHDDAAFVRHPGMRFKLSQGVTSEVSGNCGFSAMPFAPDRPTTSGLSFPGDWRTLEEYRTRVAAAQPAINTMMLVGHNTVRAYVMGAERRAATSAEVDEMRRHVREAMEHGACGFSTGLIYEPGRYSDTDEVAALASEAADFGGLYATHMRNEGDQLLDAVEEALDISRRSGAPLHISHHKAAGRANWGRVRESLARVDEANTAGADVTLDVYPYTAGSGPLWQYVNPERINREWAQNVRIANCPEHREYEGRTVPEIAAAEGVDIEDVILKCILGPKGKQTICIHFIIDEADIETNLRHPRMMIGSDGIPDLDGMPHPRLYGTMTRVLGHYVRERGVLPLEEAVRRMTSLAADRFGMTDRGRIAEGFHADLVLFDPETVRDEATYDDPQRESSGISLVAVNGEIAYEDGQHTGAGAGRVLHYQE